MITPERLKELIEQGATIWYVGTILKFKYNLDKTYYVEDNYLMQSYCEFDDDVVTRTLGILDNLFETKEDAEEYLEFGNVTREERLYTPNYEEFLDKKFVYFYNKNYNNCCLHYLNASNEIYINIGGNNVITVGSLTKENYLKARRMCVKLFKGGKV